MTRLRTRPVGNRGVSHEAEEDDRAAAPFQPHFPLTLPAETRACYRVACLAW